MCQKLIMHTRNHATHAAACNPDAQIEKYEVEMQPITFFNRRINRDTRCDQKEDEKNYLHELKHNTDEKLCDSQMKSMHCRVSTK